MECGTCVNWRPTSIENRSEEFGACHYWAPLGALGTLDAPPERIRWYFPLTVGDNWCSSYMPIREETTARAWEFVEEKW